MGKGSVKDKTDVISSHTLEAKIEEAKKTKASLRQMTGAFIGRKYPLEKGSTIIGRDPGLDITVVDNSVSRRHAEIILNDDEKLTIIDLESTNGSFINDKPIKNAVAEAGDLIRFGNIVFKYLPSGTVEGVFHDALHNLAHLDGLTNAYNRKYISDFLETEFKRCKKLSLPLSLIIFDLDHFKNVNDTYGHLAGDFILKETVKLLKDKVLRASDILGRYGGEEFTIILSESALKSANDVAERMRAAIESHTFVFQGKKIDVTISIGVAELTNKIPNASGLISIADKALYKAKNTGRNKVCSQ